MGTPKKLATPKSVANRLQSLGEAAGCMIPGILFLMIVLFIGGCNTLIFIQPEERGVVISALSSQGYRENALDPGLQFVIPFAESVRRYSIAKETYTMSGAPGEGNVQGNDAVEARTADGQEIFIDASVIYAVDPAQVIDVHITWQNRYSNDLIRPLARGIIRDAVSQFGVEEVVTTRRDELTNLITTKMESDLSDNGLILSNFVLRNITFSPEYAASVEQKQIAEQQAQQAQFVVEQRRQEAEQARQVAQGRADARLIEAQAEADSLELIGEALTQNPNLITYQYVEKLSPGIQVMLVPNNAPYLLPSPTELAGPPFVQAPPAQPQPEPEAQVE